MENVGHKTLETMSFAKWYNKWIFSLMKRKLGEEILEVGAGIGNFTELLTTKGKVTAIDIDKKYLSGLKKRFKGRAIVGFGDIEKNVIKIINSRSKKYDSIVCLNVVEHIQKDGDALRNMFRLIKKNGKLFLLVPAHKLLFSNFDLELGHFRRYSKKEVEIKLKDVGFTQIKSSYLNWWAAIGWLIFIKILRYKSMPRPPVLIFDILGRIFLLPERFIKFPFGLSVYAEATRK